MNKVLTHILNEVKEHVDGGEIRRKHLTDKGIELGYEYEEFSSMFTESARGSIKGRYEYDTLLEEAGMHDITPAEASPDTTYNHAIILMDGVPKLVKEYIKWGNYNKVSKIVDSGEFFPTLVTGLSGNGKTMMVQQICAKKNKPMVRVQINPETDETDLIGGFQLKNGETVFQKGPVIHAMEKGYILLIDEIDRGSNRLMCLQGILEGSDYLIKKTGEVIQPAPGFNIIATANTKGQGDETGKFIAATIIDDAFLERFVATICQPYPNEKTELSILQAHYGKDICEDTEHFLDCLCKWGKLIRDSYVREDIEDVISTRRLCHIVKTFKIFRGNKLGASKKEAIQMCIDRFSAETRDAFLEIYQRIDDWSDTPIADLREREAAEELAKQKASNKPSAEKTKSSNGKCPF